MSSYINFFVRSPSDEFCPIGSFSRNNPIYQRLHNNVPYEAVSAISVNAIQGAISDLQDEKKTYESHMAEQLRLAEDVIPKYNNSVDEKTTAIEEILQTVQEIKEEIEGIDRAISYLYSITVIIDDVGYGDGRNQNQYIYAGIEVPSDEIKVIERGENDIEN